MALHPGNCPLEDEFKHFKEIVTSLIGDTSEVPARIELLSHGAEREEEINLSDRYLDHTRIPCESHHDEEPDEKRNRGQAIERRILGQR